MTITHYLGITPKWVDGTAVGGCSFMIHVRHAAAAIASGLCDTVLITRGESGSLRGRRTRRSEQSPQAIQAAMSYITRFRHRACNAREVSVSSIIRRMGSEPSLIPRYVTCPTSPDQVLLFRIHAMFDAG